MGFSLLEISVTVLICFLGFVLKQVFIAVIGMFGSVFIIRYVKEFLKKSRFKRRLFFIFSDLFSKNKTGYYGKFYL